MPVVLLESGPPESFKKPETTPLIVTLPLTLTLGSNAAKLALETSFPDPTLDTSIQCPMGGFCHVRNSLYWIRRG